MDNIYCTHGLNSLPNPNLITYKMNETVGYTFRKIYFNQKTYDNMTCFNFSGISESFTIFGYLTQHDDDNTANCTLQRALLWRLYIPIEGIHFFLYPQCQLAFNHSDPYTCTEAIGIGIINGH